jgi:hypothetical protein
MHSVSNLDFLKTLFGDDHIWAHVTSFPDDPTDIPTDRRGVCWAGGYFKNTYLQPLTNQYYCISTFYDDGGRAVRRKANYRATHVIVADDVREKLDVAAVERLPTPTFKLESSPGSEQWGWVLDWPCTERKWIENLLDGLVERGLAPDGKDPGMKGVTRYVRLPEGVNAKANRVAANGGTPPRCKMVEWNPEIRVSIEELARPFGIDLDQERRDTRTDGATDVPDHPMLNTFAIEVKEIRSPGRFEITCPWVHEHTNQADDGAAVFTNADGSIGFKCHHGSCADRTGRDLINHIEQSAPGFRQRLNAWQTMKKLNEVGATTPDFMGAQEHEAPVQSEIVSYQDLMDNLRRKPAHTAEAAVVAYEILRAVDGLDHGSRLIWWNQVKDYMRWTRADFSKILQQQREIWYAKDTPDDFYESFVYVAEQNQFYNPDKRMWLTAEAFQNAFGHFDNEARAEALMQGKTQKVDRLDYAPGMPKIFTERGVAFVNGWVGNIEQGAPGDVTRWLDHFGALGWTNNADHILKWMAYTLRHPERKINHMLILAGGEGNGKDFLLYPLINAMGKDCTVIHGDELLRDFDDYLLSTKYLHINECDLGDRREAQIIHNKLKAIAAAPPHYTRVNQKNRHPFVIRNIINGTMTSNSAVPIDVKSDTRRYYAVWSDLNIRGVDKQIKPSWQNYWDDRWAWMRDQEGWKACVYYLMTQVDLSDFDPCAAPPVTDYMQSIQEAGQDPIAYALNEFILEHQSYMDADLVTNEDIREALKTLSLSGVGVDLKSIPQPATMGKIMRQNGLGTQIKMWDGQRQRRVWATRNIEEYQAMDGVEVYGHYLTQHKRIKEKIPLKLVEKEG